MRVVGLWFIHTFQRPRIPITADYCAHMLPHVRFPCQGPRRFACGAAAGAGAVVPALWCLRCGACAVVLVLVLVLWCWCWCLRCGAGACAVVLVLWCWCWCCGAGACAVVLPAAWRAQFPCARIGCIPHEVQGHRRTRAAYVTCADSQTTGCVGSCDSQLVVLRSARKLAD